MEADLQSQVAFYLTGSRTGDRLEAVDGLGLRPALLSGYRDLTKLRYDFPLVLVEGETDDAFVQPLSGLVDGVLARVAGGDDGDRIRKHVHALEQEIRKLVAAGASGRLSALWEKAAKPLASSDKSVAESLARARAALKADGEVVDCDPSMPSRLLTHGWNALQNKKAKAFGDSVTRLMLKLSDILKADFVHSEAGQSAENLKAGVGSAHADAFDFNAMARILKKAAPKTTLPEKRRKRIRQLLSVLQTQRFFPVSGSAAKSGEAPYSFAFKSCGDALKAYRERLPRAIEFAKTMAIADLEAKGEYNESKHDPIFEPFGENGMSPRDMAQFPDYLVCLKAEDVHAGETDKLTEILTAGLPMNVLVQADDIMETSTLGNGHLAVGVRGKQLASMAMGLGGVFVLQSSSSNLVSLRDDLRAALAYPGPALFSVFSGATGAAGGIPPYLIAAAATESRAFPTFTYDPSAGHDWASRFCVKANPQPELDWPVQEFAYEDEDHQRVTESVAFTLIDFVACDPRFGKHFAKVPREKWNGSMIPAGESLARETAGIPDKVPSVLMVDRDQRLQRVVVDEALIREARRCRERWHSLQELGGIHNSHAENLLAREKKVWEEHALREAESRASAPAPAAAAPAAATPAAAPAAAAPAVAAPAAAAPAAAPAAAQAEPEKSRDDAYIETPRCSTCNECITLNNKMFAYDSNQQAYIADVNAGTYAQLVEAAENCQVSVIHPGKPRNPDEPGLEELLKRAEPFL